MNKKKGKDKKEKQELMSTCFAKRSRTRGRGRELGEEVVE
jgi:hypothetical protein